MKYFVLSCFCMFIVNGINAQPWKDSSYYRKLQEPGVKMIPVYNGRYHVFTQKKGHGSVNLLLLHGGPGNGHEYFENFPSNLPGVTVYFYDQLGNYYSDQPDDSTIWNVDRFVEEVEEVRKGLGLDSFFLLGHSWGGMLGELYAAKYGQHLRGLVLSNIPGFSTKDPTYFFSLMDSLDAVAKQRAESLPAFSPHLTQLDSIKKGVSLSDTASDRYLKKRYSKVTDSFYLRMMYYNKPGPLPEPLSRSMKHIASIGKDFRFLEPDYMDIITRLELPVLLIGSRYDFLGDERYYTLRKTMKSRSVTVYLCPDGTHFPMWDDTRHYFDAIRKFFKATR